MISLLERAVATLSGLPAAQQDEIALLLLEIAGVEQSPCILSPEQEADLMASRAEAARGEFATDEEVRELWAEHGL